MTIRRQQPDTEESFAPTGSRIFGLICIGVAALIVVDILVEWQTRPGVTMIGALTAVTTVIWVGLVRPAVNIREDVLVLRNYLRDTRIPWPLITEVSGARGLAVSAGDRSYRSVAITIAGPNRREMWRAAGARNRQQPFGARGTAAMDVPRRPTPTGRRPTRLEHVVGRLQNLARQRSGQAQEHDRVRRTWAWPELAAFVAGLAVAIGGNLLTA